MKSYILQFKDTIAKKAVKRSSFFWLNYQVRTIFLAAKTINPWKGDILIGQNSPIYTSIHSYEMCTLFPMLTMKIGREKNFILNWVLQWFLKGALKLSLESIHSFQIDMVFFIARGKLDQTCISIFNDDINISKFYNCILNTNANSLWK